MKEARKHRHGTQPNVNIICDTPADEDMIKHLQNKQAEQARIAARLNEILKKFKK